MDKEKKLKIFYALSAAALLAAVALTAVFTYKYVDRLQGGHAKILNVAGKQRYMSQHIVRLVLQLSQAESPDKAGELQDLIDEDLDKIQSNHNWLVSVQKSHHFFSREIEQLRAIYFNEPHQINRRLEQFLASAKAVIQKSGLEAADPDLADFVANADSLYAALDHAAESYESILDRDFERLIHFIMIIWGLSLALIGLIFMIIVYPAMSSLEEAGSQLKKKENELNTFLNKSHDLIFTCDTRGLIISINDKAARLTKYTSEDLAGTPLLSHFVEIPDNKIIADLMNKFYEVNLVKKDGSLMAGKLLIARSGNHILAFIEEMTLFKEAESELIESTRRLKESDERYNLAINGAAVGIFDWKIAENKLYLSSICNKILGGTDREEVTDFKHFMEHIHSNDRERVVKEVNNHLYKQGNNKIPDFKIEYRFIHKEGHEIWIHSRGQVLWDSEGNPYRMAGSIQDVTEQKKNQKNLKESEERYKLAINGSAAGIFDWQIEKDEVYLSPVCNKILGLDEQAAVHSFNAFIELVHPDDRERLVRATNDHLDKKSDFDVEYRIKKCDEGMIWVKAKGQALWDEEGKPHRMAGSIEDITKKKETFEALKLSEKRHQIALMGSSVGIWDWDIESDSLYASDLCYELAGITDKNKINDLESFASFIHPEDRELVLSMLQEHLKGHQKYELEYRVRHKKGHYIWIHARGQAVWDKEGKPIHMAGSLDDITEERRVKDALKESEERYRLATQGLSVGLWDWDLKNDEIRLSKKFQQILQLPDEKRNCSYEFFLSLIHPEDLSSFKALMDGHLQYNQNFDLQLRLKHGEFKTMWVQMNGQATWNDQKKPYRMVGSINDITDRVEFQKALKESEASFRYLQTVSTSQNMDLSEKITSLLHFCNERFQTEYAVFGRWEDGEIIVQNVITPDSKILSGDRFPHANSFMTPIHDAMEPLQIKDLSQSEWKELEFFNDMAITTYLGTPVITEGKKYGAICFFNRSTTEPIEHSKREITFLNIVATWIGMEVARQQYQERLKEEKIKADQANRAKTEFLQNISHEIRTPMNGIMGMTYLLMETSMDEAQQKYSKGVITSAENLLTIVEDILDISRIEAGKISFNRASFDMKKLTTAIAKQNASLIKNRDINFLLRYDPNAPEFFIEDSDRIRQIIENLVTNAIKFTHSGYIYLNVSLAEEQENTAKLKISVEDTGIGIDEDKQKKIFDKFQQVDSSSSRKYGGLGIGLAICKNLVKLMDGELEVKSRPGIGSTFVITLNLKKDPEKNHKRSPPGNVAGKNAFILTDNKTFGNIISESFKTAGIECQSSKSLDGLLKKLEKKPDAFDVVIIDELALDENLWQKVEGFQKNQTGKQLPLILIEHSFSEIPSYTLNGWRAVFTKPLLADHLLREVVAQIGSEEEQSEPATKRKSKSVDMSRMDSPRILVVEDDPVNQLVIRDLLENWGCNPTIAGDGNEAVAQAKQHRFDLILMDCVMPGMDGYETTRTIREVEKERNIDKTPIVALTARVGKGEDTKCYESGMDDYVPKPLNKEIIQKTLKKWLDKP